MFCRTIFFFNSKNIDEKGQKCYNVSLFFIKVVINVKKIISVLLTILMIPWSFSVLFINTEAAFSGADKINIVLDPGHGGSNIGCSANGIGEKEYTLRLANLIKNELVANGSFNVYLTRSSDTYLEHYQRAEIANDCNADILISLHFDGSDNPGLSGVTAYNSVFDKYAMLTLSNSICQNISSAIGLSSNGVKRKYDTEGYYWNYEKQWDCQDPSLGTLSDFYGIPTWGAKFGFPAIIIEHGFFSNASDRAKLLASGAMEAMAHAEAQAIIDYYTNHTHVYGAQQLDYPSNCVYQGKSSQHCSYCGHRTNVVSADPAPDNHYWIEMESIEPSCGVDGKIGQTCRITQTLKKKGWTGEEHENVVVIPAPSQHSYAIVKQVNATHTQDGYTEWKCSTCSSSFKDIIKAEGHSYEYTGYKEPNCTESGGHSYKCSKCSHSYTETESALGHTYELISSLDPTCTDEGNTVEKCSACAYENITVIPPLGHDLPEGSVMEATCTEVGYVKGTCARCAAVLDEETPALGHTLEVLSETPATCSLEGSSTSKCTVCSEEITTTLSKLEHTYEKAEELPATCEKEGSITYTCTLCSHTYSKKSDPLGHKKGEDKKIDEDSGFFTSGSAHFTCKNGCGRIYTVKIPSFIEVHKTELIISSLALMLLAATVLFLIFFIRKKKEGEKTVLETEIGDTPMTEDEKKSEESPEEKEESSPSNMENTEDLSEDEETLSPAENSSETEKEEEKTSANV